MKNKKSLLTFPYVLWIILFTILPVGFLFFYAFYDKGFSLEYIKEAFSSIHLMALWNSIKLSFWATFVCLLISYPLGLALKSMKFKRKSILIMMVVAPMWMNYVLRIMAWQLILSQNGFLNQFLRLIHLPTADIGNSTTAILIGMVYDYLPFMLLPVYNSIAEIQNDVIEAAYDLGANKFTVLKKIMIPLSMPGIISGIIMVFVPALTTFAISDMLGGGKVMLIGNVIEQEFISSLNWNLGSALSLILMIFVIPGLFSKGDSKL